MHSKANHRVARNYDYCLDLMTLYKLLDFYFKVENASSHSVTSDSTEATDEAKKGN